MKKLSSIAFMLFLFHNFSYAQVGINTENPSNTLHVKNTEGVDPVRIEGIQKGSGELLVVDEDGIVKKAYPSQIHLPFVLPAVSNTVGVTLSVSSQTGSNIYTQGSSPTGSIPGGGSWTKIPGLETTFDIIDPNNTISMSVEGIAQYNADMSEDASVSFAIGIFVDNKLEAVRFFAINGSRFSTEAIKWEALGQVSDLSVGSHTVEVYATRRNSTPTSPSQPAHPSASLAIAQPAPSSSNLNQFMARGVLNISGVYY